MKFAKYLRTPILKNICERLVLEISSTTPSMFQTKLEADASQFALLVQSNVLMIRIIFEVKVSSQYFAALRLFVTIYS